MSDPPIPPPIQPLPPSRPPLPPLSGAGPAPLGVPEGEARTWNMLCHVSVLAGFVVPLGNLWCPLLIWQIKKHEIPSVIVHGKAALNFQFTVILWFLASAALVYGLSFFCIGFVFAFVPVLVVLAGVVFPVISGINANDGKPFRYPCLIEFLK